MTTKITRRQREVIDYLSEHAAHSSEHACLPLGSDTNTAEALTFRGVLNKRYGDDGALYWIRGEKETMTGTRLLAGFMIILHRDVTTPSGRAENFFLARAPYDGKGATFRSLLRDWMRTLGLQRRDLLGSYMGFEQISADSPVFHGDHVILSGSTATQPPPPPRGFARFSLRACDLDRIFVQARRIIVQTCDALSS